MHQYQVENDFKVTFELSGWAPKLSASAPPRFFILIIII
jgi:hypothetical protein